MLREQADMTEQSAAAMDEYELGDTRRRINNLLQQGCPVDGLTIDEAKTVLAALSGVYRARHEDVTMTVSLAVRLSSGGTVFESSWSLPAGGALPGAWTARR
jgi:hypothetical protein